MYSTVMNMSKSVGLKNRLIGAAALEGRADANIWVEQNLFSLINDTSWVTAWEYAEDTKTVNVNPDTGARDDVINDSMILAAVQATIEATKSVETTPGNQPFPGPDTPAAPL